MAKRQLSASPARARKRQATRSSSPESSDDSRSSTEQVSDADSEVQSDSSDTQSDTSESTSSEDSSVSAASSSNSRDPPSEEQRLDTEKTEEEDGLKARITRKSINNAAPQQKPITTDCAVKRTSPGPRSLVDTKAAGEDVEIPGTIVTRSRETSYAETVILPSLAEAVDQFPFFASGDVVIVMKSSSWCTTLRLHSCALGKFSTFFSDSLSQVDPDDAEPTCYLFAVEESNGSYVTLRYTVPAGEAELLPRPSISITRQRIQQKSSLMNQGPAEIGNGEIKIKTEETVDRALSPPPSSVPVPMDTNKGALTIHQLDRKSTLPYWYQVLGAFYNVAPLVSATNIAVALAQAEELVKVAIQLGSLQVLRPFLGNVLGQYRQTLFIAIKNDPTRWILLATALENEAIYTECLIHLVGAWPFSLPFSLVPTKRIKPPDWLRQLVARKGRELEQQHIEVERELLMLSIELYPSNRRISAADHGQIGTWILLQLFRDTLAGYFATFDDNKRIGVQKRGWLYRNLRKGGSALMEYEQVKATCEGIMNLGWKDLGYDLKTLKGYAGTVVKDLAKNELMIDPDEHKIGYLTCTKVQPADIPWKQAVLK